MRQRKIRFLVLTAFSSMGGIEKFNRAFMLALVQLQERLHYKVNFSSMHDRGIDTRYIPSSSVQIYNGNKGKFVFRSFFQSFFDDELILGHLNLAVLGVLFKFFKPRKKLIIICHGIEVFEPLSGFKKRVLKLADQIFVVSSFTKNKLVEVQGIPANKVQIFPNTLDPYFVLPEAFKKPSELLERYGIQKDEKIIFTLTRINSAEGYKGYDKVIKALPILITKGLKFKYILAGKADEHEKNRISELIKLHKLDEYVIMPGYIADEEITAHYLLADLFVMPSKGEGFGIVFLEAMACGLSVIAGNLDGSVDALKNGELGTLINPDNIAELEAAITKQLSVKYSQQALQTDMLAVYSFEKYKKRLQNLLSYQYAV